MTTDKLELPGRRKANRSKLDPYREQLQEMERQNIGIVEMQRWLEKQGVKSESGTISAFLNKHRLRRYEEYWLQQIYSGAQQCKEVDAAFAENPAPAMETLIKMHRVLIMELMTKENEKEKEEEKSPDMDRIKLSNQLTKTVLSCMAMKTRTELKERELSLAEARAAMARNQEQEEAMQWCMEAVKAFPEVAALFKTAFDRLKEKITGNENC